MNAPQPAHPALARLLIHAEAHARAGWTRWWPRPPAAPLQLQVDDLTGARVLTLDDAAPQVALALPPGTYQVTARRGRVCRCYTITLADGASFELAVALDAHPL